MIDPLVQISVTFWLLAMVAGTGLIAPFWKGSRKADAHWVPLALGIGSALASWFGNRKKAKAEEAARKQYNADQEAQQLAARNFLAEMAANPHAYRRSTTAGGWTPRASSW